ncbi:hypothetical protein [Mucilaginibacter terrae]|uniref:Uncharacterized protein n=1 Tax=Mucilaginibacter terrae TaxID=1955052 RepID=A0ABU3GZS6_9SPHI|nr:hypothetical protein [Mucilaginibacter terrae]MDT3405175.1 hypothetical protein [Mucilaginibacter terrae]
MNIDDLKATWQQYDQKLQASQTLSQRIIESIIAEKSQSRLSRVQNHFTVGCFILLLWLMISIAILTGNPFDYQNSYEYVPVVLLALSLVAMLVLLGKAIIELKEIDLSQTNLAKALKQVINVYSKPRKFLKYAFIMMFSAGLLFPLSFLPRKLNHSTMAEALTNTAGPMAISIILFYITHKFGALEDVAGKRFKQYLHELEEMNAVSKELY